MENTTKICITIVIIIFMILLEIDSFREIKPKTPAEMRTDCYQKKIDWSEDITPCNLIQ